MAHQQDAVQSRLRWMRLSESPKKSSLGRESPILSDGMG
jgi:hypothetical protein